MRALFIIHRRTNLASVFLAVYFNLFYLFWLHSFISQRQRDILFNIITKCRKAFCENGTYIFRSRFKIDASYPFISFYLTLVTHALSISPSLPNVTRSHLYSFRLHILALLCVYLIWFFHVDRKFRAHENTQNLLNCQHTITVAIANLYIYLFSSIWFSHHFASHCIHLVVLFWPVLQNHKIHTRQKWATERRREKKVFRCFSYVCRFYDL